MANGGDITIRVGADFADLRAGMKEAVSSLDGFRNQMQKFGSEMTSLGQSMSLQFTAPLTLMGGAALKTAADFQSAMNQVAAVSGATESELAAMTAQARELGATTQFSASQAAEAMGFLAMAGFRTGEIMDALPATLNLAAAANVDLGRAADIASNILTGFGFAATDLAGVNDVLVATFTRTNTNLSMLGESMKFVAPIASSAGFSFEETAAAIGLMGNAGIQGSMAGTALRGAISRLLNPTRSMQETMDKLGVSVMDSNGKLLPMVDILRQLEASGATTTDVITIFGQEAGPGISGLLGQGSAALADLTAELQNSGGAADRIAKTQMQGLNGALKTMRSAVEEAAIVLGNDLMPMAERVAGGISRAATAFGQLSPEVRQAIIVVAALAAAIGPVLIVVGQVATGLSNLIQVGQLLGTGIGKLTGLFVTFQNGAAAAGPVIKGVGAALSFLAANPIVAAVAAIAALIAIFATLMLTNEDFRNKVLGIWQAVKDGIGSAVDGIRRFFTGLGESISSTVSGAVDRVGQMRQAVSDKFQEMATIVRTFKDNTSQAITSAVQMIRDQMVNVAKQAVDAFARNFPEATRSITLMWEEAKKTTEAAKSAITTGVNALVSGMQSAWSTLTSATSQAWNSVSTTVSSMWGSIRSTISAGVSSAVSMVSDLWKRVVDLGRAGADAFLNLVGRMRSRFEQTMTQIKSSVQSFTGAVRGLFDRFASAVRSLIDSFLGQLRRTWEAHADTVRTVVKAFTDQVKLTFETMIRIVSDILRAFFAALRGDWGAALDAVKSAVKAGLDFVTGTFRNLGTAVGAVMRDVATSITGQFRSAVDQARSIVESGINGILGFLGGLASRFFEAGRSIVSRLVDGLKSIAIPKIGPGASGEASAVPMAHGGIVTKPTLALIGERGPEAVIPLSRGRDSAAGGFGGGPTLIQNITAQATPDDLQRFTERALRKLSVDWGLT